MKQFIKTMKALSDPNRVKVIKMLKGRELCVCEITEALQLAQSTVSKHLRILEEAGVVLYRKLGPWIFYRLADTSGEYPDTMLGHLKIWLEEDPQVLDVRRRVNTINLKKICRINEQSVGRQARLLEENRHDGG
jgi:ArsR family transcriptional regulator